MRNPWQRFIAWVLASILWVVGLDAMGGDHRGLVLSATDPPRVQLPEQSLSAEEQLQLGMDYYRQQQLEAAIAAWQTALEQYRTDQNQAGERQVLELLTFVHLELGQHRQVLTLGQQTIAAASGPDQAALRARTYANLGIAHNALGNYLAAILAYETSLLDIRNSDDADNNEAHVLGLLANAYEGLGNYERTVELHQQSLTLAQENPRQQAVTHVNLGATYARLGDYDQAILQYQTSLALFQALNDQLGQAYALNNLGAAYYAQGQFNQAEEQLEQALNTAQTSRQPALISAALGSLGSLYTDQGKYPQALEYHGQSLELARATADPKPLATALNNLGHTLFKSGQLEAAEAKLYEAIDVLESLRPGLDDTSQISLFDTQVLTYNLLQQVLVAQDNIEAALEVAERGRARAFVELIANSANPTNPTNPTNPINSLAMAAPAPTMDQIRDIAQQQRATLVEYTLVPDDSFRFQGKQRGTAERLYIWVVQPTGDVTFRQIDLTPLQQERGLSIASLVEISRDLSGIRGASRDFSTAPEMNTSAFAPVFRQRQHWRSLHQLLIEPIADLLPTEPTARVVFVPQEQLFLVPFPALQAQDGSYLIEHHTILSAPAIQILGLTHRDRQPASPASHPLVVGNPSPMPDNLPPLPHAETEADGIAQILSTRPLLGQTATETAIKQQLSTAPLIHLATHGFFNESNPLQGSLALAPSDNQDGLLTAAEILDQSLQANLVVLSACDTGRGKITGDGVIGLSRSFLAAGANNVMVSLWQVPDDATAQLMLEFYRQRQQLDNAQALRQAMLTIRQTYDDPVAWAAFTLIGAMEL